MASETLQTNDPQSAELMDDLTEKALDLQELIDTKFNPHTTIIVTSNRVTVLEDIVSVFDERK